ncbi:MAG: hypothetical protein ACRDND_33200, partial [Streptosporangiaceae bacterium]
AVLAALASPELTGLPPAALDDLAAALELPWAAAREQRLHLDRGHSRRTATGRKGPDWLTLRGQLLTAILRHRHGMPGIQIAALLGADPSTINDATRQLTALLGPGHPALAPGPARLRTPGDLRSYAATSGITIPDPPPVRRRRHSTSPARDTPETRSILE